jgi:hypothetical protein
MLPHHSSSISTQLQEDSMSVSCAGRERTHQLGFPARRAHHSLGGIRPSRGKGILGIPGSGFPLQVSWHHSWWFFKVFQWRIDLY